MCIYTCNFLLGDLGRNSGPIHIQTYDTTNTHKYSNTYKHSRYTRSIRDVSIWHTQTYSHILICTHTHIHTHAHAHITMKSYASTIWGRYSGRINIETYSNKFTFTHTHAHTYMHTQI